MRYRLGLLLLGSFFLGLGLVGGWVAWTGKGVVHLVVEGLRAAGFVLLGVFMVTTAVRGDPGTARQYLVDFARDVFSRKNLKEFAGFWALVAMMVAGRLLWKRWR